MSSRVAEEAGAGRRAPGARAPGLISAHPVLAVAAGAACIAPSAILVRVSGASPATAAAFRCAYALPFLALLAWAERRGQAPAGGGDGGGESAPAPPRRPARWRRPAAAGVLFAVDLVLWHHAIRLAGAGIATVLGNLQVIFVGLGAWAAFGERPGRRLAVALPAVIAGVTAISGVVGAGAYGPDPARAVVYCLISSAAYAGFILVLRGRASGPGESGASAGPLLVATGVAAAASAALGVIPPGVNLAPSWPAHGWLILLALTSQVAGWSLISRAMRLLPAALTALLLLLQPVMAVGLSMAALGERPSAWQLAGCALVLAGVVYAASRPAGSGGAPHPAAATRSRMRRTGSR